MQALKLVDKLLIYLLKSYKENNNTSNLSFVDISKKFTDYEEVQLIEAITKLKTDRFIEVMYYNSKPGSIFVKLSAFSQMNENVFNSKGYTIYKEIMDIVVPPKRRTLAFTRKNRLE